MSMVKTVPTNFNVKDEDKLQTLQKVQKSNRMYSIGKEICFLLLIAFTTYASFTSNERSRKGINPTPFFPKGSLVGDFYNGEISEALVRAKEGDLAFIMLYAPWDTESQVARKEFEAVAHQHYKQIYFAAINCWHPQGECKKALNSIQQFPQLVAYLTHEKGIEYRGPRDARYMSAFLKSVRQPLYRVHGLADLIRLRSTHNAVVVAYLNFDKMRGGVGYRAIYETALKFLSRDIMQEVAFGVVTSFKTAQDMGVNVAPCIRLHLWNETLDYQGHLHADQISVWVTSRLHQVTLWLTPPGVKSFTLAPYVTHGPTLIMFTTYNNFVMYDLLREVSLEYYNCNNSSEITKLAQNISNSVSERLGRMRRATLSCQSHMQDLFPTSIQIVNSVWANGSCGPRCSPLVQCCQHQSIMTDGVTPQSDPLAASALSLWVWREKCRALTVPPQQPPRTELPAAVQGLACRNNRTVSLLALDSSLFGHFASSLGLEVQDTTKVVVLDSQMESTHVLDEALTKESLGQFLVNFTEGKLDRVLRTGQFLPPATDPPATISVSELTSDTFLSVALNESMNVVVMYYSPYCAFCHTISPAFLATARLLRGMSSLQFTRIDGESNDLPWQYTAPYYPSILFFPARRKAESRVFSPGSAVNIDSLTRFILANLPLDLRLQASVQICYIRFPRAQGTARLRECLVDVRKLVLAGISAHLSRYRAILLYTPHSRERRKELQRQLAMLQYLKELQLTLSLSPLQTVNFPITRVHDEL